MALPVESGAAMTLSSPCQASCLIACPAHRHSEQEMSLSEEQRAAIEAMTEEGDIYGRLASSIAPEASACLLGGAGSGSWAAAHHASSSVQANDQQSPPTTECIQSCPLAPAPQIYGHEDVKKALLLAMVGGVSKVRRRRAVDAAAGLGRGAELSTACRQPLLCLLHHSGRRHLSLNNRLMLPLSTATPTTPSGAARRHEAARRHPRLPDGRPRCGQVAAAALRGPHLAPCRVHHRQGLLG